MQCPPHSRSCVRPSSIFWADRLSMCAGFFAARNTSEACCASSLFGRDPSRSRAQSCINSKRPSCTSGISVRHGFRGILSDCSDTFKVYAIELLLEDVNTFLVWDFGNISPASWKA